MAGAENPWTWYKVMFGATLATGAYIGAVGWNPDPVVSIRRIVGMGIVGLFVGSFVGLCVKAIAFEKVNTRGSWIGVIILAVVATVVATLLLALMSFTR